MSPVGLANTRISTGYADKNLPGHQVDVSPWPLDDAHSSSSGPHIVTAPVGG